MLSVFFSENVAGWRLATFSRKKHGLCPFFWRLRKKAGRRSNGGGLGVGVQEIRVKFLGLGFLGFRCLGFVVVF